MKSQIFIFSNTAKGGEAQNKKGELDLKKNLESK